MVSPELAEGANLEGGSSNAKTRALIQHPQTSLILPPSRLSMKGPDVDTGASGEAAGVPLFADSGSRGPVEPLRRMSPGTSQGPGG